MQHDDADNECENWCCFYLVEVERALQLFASSHILGHQDFFGILFTLYELSIRIHSGLFKLTEWPTHAEVSGSRPLLVSFVSKASKLG